MGLSTRTTRARGGRSKGVGDGQFCQPPGGPELQSKVRFCCRFAAHIATIGHRHNFLLYRGPARGAGSACIGWAARLDIALQHENT